MPVTGPTMKEIAKNPPAPVDAKEAKGSAKKKGDKGAEKAPVKEKPKRKGPLDVLPHNTEEWAVYDVPDEVRICFLDYSKLKMYTKLNATCIALIFI